MKVDMNAEMLNLLAAGADLRTVINRGASLLQNPMLVTDTRYRILFMSDDPEPDIEMWKKSKEDMSVSEQVLMDMEKSNITKALSASAAPVISELPNGYHSMRIGLVYKNRYRGFLGMYDYLHPFTRDDEEGMAAVTKAVVALLPGNKDLINVDENTLESMLYELLRSQNQGQSDAVLRKYSAVVTSRQKVLMLLRSDGSARVPVVRMKKVLHREMYKHTSVVLDNSLVMLFSPETVSESASLQAIEHLGQVLKEYHYYAGASLPFSDAAFVPDALVQAQFALQYVTTDSPYTAFEDYMLNAYIAYCLEKEPAEFFIHPFVRKLWEHDQEYHLDYLETLRIFILSGGNLKTSAEKLEIHYNTMKYRIAVIENICGEDIRTRTDLYPVLYMSMCFLEKKE